MTRALVTGGASGIGAATAARLRAENWHVTTVDLAAADGDHVVADVTDPAAWDDLVSGLDGLDLAYLNAGILGRSMTEQGFGVVFDPTELDIEHYRRTMAVNVDGVVFGTRALTPLLAASGGAFVATASVAGLVPWAPDPIYTATKHAVIGWVRAIAPGLAAQGVSINAICPGGVATAMTGMGEGPVPKGFIDPATIADAVLRAASSGETGQAYTVLVDQDPLPHSFNNVKGFPV